MLRKKKFPGPRLRFWTSNLKVRPAKRFYENLQRCCGGFEVWIGVRKSESAARQKRYVGIVGDELISPNDFMSEFPKRMEKNGIMFRLPIIDWIDTDVFDYLNGEENPLYKKGQKRVGCFPCLASDDKNKIAHFEFDDFGKSQLEKIKVVEIKINKKVLRKDVLNTDSAPCSICNI